jgi:Eco57I restriction-modification methylase
LATRILHFATQGDETTRFLFRFACQESLLRRLPKAWPCQYDAVVGNPPWGARKSWVPAALRHQFEPLLMGHYDVYLAFILRAHSLLKPGGYLSYVIPSGFLFNCTAAPVRRLLLENYDILALTIYSQRSFVEVPCVIPISFLARKKDRAGKRVGYTKITNADTGLGGPLRKIESARVRVAHIWKKLPGCGINPLVRNETAFLAKDLPGVPLREFGHVSSGARFGKTNRVRPTAAFRGIRACDMRPYHACPRGSRLFRTTDGVFDRVPDEAAIEVQKVVFQELRYMTHGKRLVSALAGPGTLPVSTAGLFVPKDRKHSRFFVALLNSAVVNAWYKLRDLNRAIKIGYLRSLPVPEDTKVWETIGLLAEACTDIRMFFHRHCSLCAIRNEGEWLSQRFPKEWFRLVEHQGEIDRKLLDLYGIPMTSRPAVMDLGTRRSF